MSYVLTIPVVKSCIPSRIAVWVLTITALLARLVPSASGSVIAAHTWDSAPHPWYETYGDVNLSWATSGGNPNGWLAIEFPSIDPVAFPETGQEKWEDIIYVNKEDLFAGNFSSGMTVAFDFYASNALPQNLQLQFASTNGNVWGYDVTSTITQTQTWTSVSVGLGYAGGWGPLPGYDDTEEQFLADLAAIDWIGIYIFREDSDLELYGLDNFRLVVPEPGQMALLSAVLFASGLNWRRKRGSGAVSS